MRAVTKPGTRPSAAATTMQASTVACWSQYGAKSAPIRFQSTRRLTLGFSGWYMADHISPCPVIID